MGLRAVPLRKKAESSGQQAEKTSRGQIAAGRRKLGTRHQSLESLRFAVNRLRRQDAALSFVVRGGGQKAEKN